MKGILKSVRFLGKTFVLIILILLLAYAFFLIKWRIESHQNMNLAGEPAPVLLVGGTTFRDLNKNGVKDVYEDPDAAIDERVENLMNLMTDEEKAGLLFIQMAVMESDGELMEIPSPRNPFSLMIETPSELILKKNITHLNILTGPSAEAMAIWNNNIQKLAERTRLGIPVTIATDPRHGKGLQIGMSLQTPFFSRWPSQLGLGATRDSALVREFGNIARQEYLALGIRLALHPMADLATDPRWARSNGVFSEDAELASKLTEAYILGFQGDSLGSHSVACMTKHFPGAGPQKDGWDAHFASGKDQVYPGNNFEYHLIPFIKGALRAKTAQIMPYYGVPKGQNLEEVGFAFNKEVITGILRNKLGFDGVICTDFGLISDWAIKDASSWGVEHLSEKQRVAKILDAGCDMMGGESRTDLVLELLRNGSLSRERLNISVRRILKDKFRLGLFDNPYAELSQVEIVGNSDFRQKGREAQRRSLVLLKNEDSLLPLTLDTKIYFEGIDRNLNNLYPQIVSSPDEADVIIKRLSTPSSPPPGGGIMEGMIPQGRLHFTKEEQGEIIDGIKSKPSVLILGMERPPIITEIDKFSKAVIADFECEDEIILELIYGSFSPTGKLPIEIPSSEAAVENQLEDVPYDSENPLYPFGFGLSYKIELYNNDLKQ